MLRDQRAQWEMGRSWKWEHILVFPWEPMTAVTSGTLEYGQGLWDKKVNVYQTGLTHRIQMSGQTPISVLQGRYFLDEINF